MIKIYTNKKKAPKLRSFFILIETIYTTPCANIASAILTNPAMLAPFT